MILSSTSLLKTSFILSVKLTDSVTFVTRYLSNLEFKQNIKGKDHVFRNVCPWKSKRELADFLLENILLNQNGLIALNKPYGVGIRPLLQPSQRDSTISRNTFIPNSENYCLFDVLPFLGNALGVEKLIIAKSAERYTSGITFLATSDSIVNRIKTCHRRDVCYKRLTSKYLAVVLGRPRELVKNETVKISLVKSADGKSKQPLIQDAITKPVASNEVRTATVEYNIIELNDRGACLIELHPSLTTWHFLRVYLAHKLIPVLGDNIYGPRVKSCLGVTVAVNPFNMKGQSQKLNPNIIRALDLTPEEEIIIPCHVHLQEVTLSSYYGKNRDLTVVAPPTEFFKWTCQRLDLKINV